MEIEYISKGNRHASGLVSISNSASTLITVPPNRKAFIRKVMIYNADDVDHTVLIGMLSGTTFTQLLPAIKVLSGQTLSMTEDEIPSEYAYSTDTTINSVAAETGEAISSSSVQIDVEIEYG